MIHVRGLRVVGTHGVLPEEQVRPQPFEVDLDVEVDLAAAAASDSLDDTVDYGALAEAAARVVATEQFALLERLAGRIGEIVLSDERVTAVTVTVKKLRPPVPLDVAWTGVTLRLTR